VAAPGAHHLVVHGGVCGLHGVVLRHGGLGKDYASSGVGRVYVANVLGLQGFSKDIRNALAAGLYWDVDMVNAHPTILVQLCQKKVGIVRD
jgi:hypothetical protein